MTGRRALGVAASAVLLVAGCGKSNAVPVSKASKLVLQGGDLARVFSSFYFGPIVRLDTLGTIRSDPQRYGRQGGWIARYHRSGSVRTLGPLVVESRADVFKAADGAKTDLVAYRTEFERMPGSKAIQDVATIGDATIAVTFTQPGRVTTRFYRIAWRDRNVSASVLLDGFEGKITLADALALARMQERRIAAA